MLRLLILVGSLVACYCNWRSSKHELFDSCASACDRSEYNKAANSTKPAVSRKPAATHRRQTTLRQPSHHLNLQS